MNAALVLANRDQLLRSGAANCVVHGIDPIREDILGEEKIVVNLQRVVADVHAACCKIDFFGERDRPLHLADGEVPRCGQRRAIGVTLVEPLVPFLQLDGVAVRAHGPKMLRDAGLVDQVPCQPWNVVEALDHGRNQCLLAANRLRIEVRVYASQYIRQEREKIELHGQTVLARGHEIGFERPQRALIRLTILVADLVPTRPPAGADHVQSRGMNLREVPIPHVDVGVIEIKTLRLTRHVGGSNDGEGLAIEFEVILVHRHARAGAQEGLVANPKSGVMDGAKLVVISVAFPQLGFYDVETRRFRSRQQ